MSAPHETWAPHGAAVAAALFAAASWAAPVNAQQAATLPPATTVYVAHLAGLNTKAAGGSVAGDATFTIAGDSLTITITASGLPPGMTHWQHLHGFADGRPAACPNASADLNQDGFIDIVETGPSVGTTMVPFTDSPVNMDVAHGVYPQASATGTLYYTRTVSLAALETSFGTVFPKQKLELDRRVVFLHGVPATTQLPATVASLGPIPAAVTLPIACGRMARVK